MSPSIDWKNRVIRVDFQKEESRTTPTDFRNKIINAISVDDNEIKQELQFIQERFLSNDENKLLDLIYEGYYQREIALCFKVSERTIRRRWSKLSKKIQNLMS